MAATKIVVYGVDTVTGNFVPLAVDQSGFLNVHITQSIPLGFTFTGALGNDADGEPTVDTGLIGVDNYQYVFNGSTFDRVRGQGNESDAIDQDPTGVVKVAAVNYVFNGATFDRVKGQGNDADTVATDAAGIAKISAFSYVFNGTTFDRVKGQGNDTDGLVADDIGVVKVGSFGYLLNDTTNLFDRIKGQGNGNDNIVPGDNGVMKVGAFGFGFNGSTFDRLKSQGTTADQQLMQAGGVALSASYTYGFNGDSFDRNRVANVFKTVVATDSGDTAVWTPASGKKFRLMGYTISVCGTFLTLGVQTIVLNDGATAVANHVAGVGATVSGDSQIAANLGQGKLSDTANNVLNITLGTDMLTGAVTINAWGTEE